MVFRPNQSWQKIEFFITFLDFPNNFVIGFEWLYEIFSQNFFLSFFCLWIILSFFQNVQKVGSHSFFLYQPGLHKPPRLVGLSLRKGMAWPSASASLSGAGCQRCTPLPHHPGPCQGWSWLCPPCLAQVLGVRIKKCVNVKNGMILKME